jgi:hypothetical protein
VAAQIAGTMVEEGMVVEAAEEVEEADEDGRTMQ